MTVTIVYESGETATLVAVETIKRVGLRDIEVTCFGNDAVRHRNVRGCVSTIRHSEEALNAQDQTRAAELFGVQTGDPA